MCLFSAFTESGDSTGPHVAPRTLLLCPVWSLLWSRRYGWVGRPARHALGRPRRRWGSWLMQDWGGFMSTSERHPLAVIRVPRERRQSLLSEGLLRHVRAQVWRLCPCHPGELHLGPQHSLAPRMLCVQGKGCLHSAREPGSRQWERGFLVVPVFRALRE